MTALYEDGAALDDALRLGAAFHAGSVWAEAPFDADAVAQFFTSLQDSPDGFLLVTATGIIGGMVMPLWFAPAWRLGAELFWFSESAGEGPYLRERFEAWARARGAATVQFSCMLNEREPALRRMYRKAGFDAIELGFRKMVG